MKVLAAILLVGLLSGCASSSFFQEAANKAGNVSKDTKKKLGQAIDSYCEQVPGTIRLGLRAEVNEYADKGKVKVTCDVDGASK